jgi:hypothetical protein
VIREREEVGPFLRSLDPEANDAAADAGHIPSVNSAEERWQVKAEV